MPYILPQAVNPNFAPYVFFDKVFSEDECKAIIAFAKLQPEHQAAVGGGEGGSVDPTKRRAKLRWVHWQAEAEWLFARLADVVTKCNNGWYQFALAGFNEPLQVGHYTAKDKGFYDWHQDWGGGQFSIRKLSFVVPLNEGYKGGEFEVYGTGVVKEATMGSAILFPSFQQHRVTPVTKGDRWSLVGWTSGPVFR